MHTQPANTLRLKVVFFSPRNRQAAARTLKAGARSRPDPNQARATTGKLLTAARAAASAP